MGLDERSGNTRKTAHSTAWRLPLVVASLSAVLVAGGDRARNWLCFERNDIAAGELWRLLSGHFVHLGLSHFLLNMAGLGLVWYLVGDALKSLEWTVVLVFSILAIDLGFWILNPELRWYVGLSGVLHALLATGLVVQAGRERKELLVIAALVAAKIAWEQASGALPGSAQASGGPVVVDAHFYGALAGVIAGALARIRVRRAAPI